MRTITILSSKAINNNVSILNNYIKDIKREICDPNLPPIKIEILIGKFRNKNTIDYIRKNIPSASTITIVEKQQHPNSLKNSNINSMKKADKIIFLWHNQSNNIKFFIEYALNNLSDKIISIIKIDN